MVPKFTVLIAVILFCQAAVSQCCVRPEEWHRIHANDLRQWEQKSGLPVLMIEKLLAAAAYSESDENQYLIENIDLKTLKRRGQTLLVTSNAGTAHCLSVSVIDTATNNYREVWQTTDIPGVEELCTESLLGQATAHATMGGDIVVQMPVRLNEEPVGHGMPKGQLLVGRFAWNGRTYALKFHGKIVQYYWNGADWAKVSNDGSRRFVSPDGAMTAIVLPSGKEEGSEESESRVEIHRRDGALLCIQDVSSSDSDHGYGVDVAQWTPDLQFFVFRMRSSGGHSPMYAPVVFWSRKANCFYQLNDYTADETFSVSSPDKVSVSTWTDMKPATISLSQLGTSDVTTLQSAR